MLRHRWWWQGPGFLIVGFFGRGALPLKIFKMTLKSVNLCLIAIISLVRHVRKMWNFFQNKRTITWQNMRQKYAEIGHDYVFFVNLTWYIFDRIAVISYIYSHLTTNVEPKNYYNFLRLKLRGHCTESYENSTQCTEVAVDNMLK